MGQNTQGDLPGQRPPALSPPAPCDSAGPLRTGCPLVAQRQHAALGEPGRTPVLSRAGRQPDSGQGARSGGTGGRAASSCWGGGWGREGGTGPPPGGEKWPWPEEEAVGCEECCPSSGDDSCHPAVTAPGEGQHRPRPSLGPEPRTQAPAEVLNHRCGPVGFGLGLWSPGVARALARAPARPPDTGPRVLGLSGPALGAWVWGTCAHPSQLQPQNLARLLVPRRLWATAHRLRHVLLCAGSAGRAAPGQETGAGLSVPHASRPWRPQAPQRKPWLLRAHSDRARRGHGSCSEALGLPHVS